MPPKMLERQEIAPHVNEVVLSIWRADQTSLHRLFMAHVLFAATERIAPKTTDFNLWRLE